MKETILVTDSLFIHKEHEDQLRAAGYEIERIDKPKPSEEEIIAAIKGKVGYILGGIESVTEKIVDAADALKVIVFAGIGYKDFIPAWEYATKKGIAIANAPDGPTHAVAEWSLAMALAMNRGIFDLGRAGQKDFMTTKGIEDQHVGIVGLGRIGKHIVGMIKPFRPASISYYSQHRHEDGEKSLGIAYKELEKLLGESDIVFVCVSKDAGQNFIGQKELAAMKDGALLVSFMSEGIIDDTALLKELSSGRLRAASDHPGDSEEFKKLPLQTWYCFNGSNAFNTFTELKITSDIVTTSLLNILQTGKDKNLVNQIGK